MFRNGSEIITPVPVVLKPHDVALLLKVIAIENRSDSQESDHAYAPIPLRRIAEAARISLSEVHGFRTRALSIGLLRSQGERRVNRTGLMELLTHGVRWVFPASHGGLVRGIPTAHAAPPLSNHLVRGSDPPPVWEHPEGNERGIALSPLYPKVPEAALLDPEYYELLALTDALRSSDTRTRERNLAQTLLQERLERKNMDAF
ncbi:MAG: hypothetical protein H8F28_23790 [Fibrella sp.]|nr:hypothetical protein [Armatimonadota bacterium]